MTIQCGHAETHPARCLHPPDDTCTGVGGSAPAHSGRGGNRLPQAARRFRASGSLSLRESAVVIEEVLGRAKQGATRPFICRGDDGCIYYVKGRGAGLRSLICEWVAARLATAFGLPIADYALAEVPAALLQFGPQQLELGELGDGMVFASRELSHAQELTVTTRELVTPRQASDVLMFDWWLRNADRCLTEYGGNVNLLWDVQAGQLAVIDHNQAFDREFDAAQFLEMHVFGHMWNAVSADLVEKAGYRLRMESALAELPDIRASIPGPWWHVDEGVPANVTWVEIADCLERCCLEDFCKSP